ncbi:hypothetical protein N752_23785 [Desulforamulus aquiferis]|nr:hypothetical protein N752_23785 [Desulforamulus aquiferis]
MEGWQIAIAKDADSTVIHKLAIQNGRWNIKVREK